MEKHKLNDTISKLMVLFVAIGVGSFTCALLDHTEINVWLARGSGACVAIVTGFMCSFIIGKLRTKT